MKMKQFNSYDYEAAYNKQNKNLESLAQKRYLDSNQKGLKYYTEIIESGNLIEVGIFPFLSKPPKTSPATRRTESRLCQKLLNRKNSKRHLKRLVHSNFGNGDYFVTLTYSEDSLPNTLSEANKQVGNFFRRLNNSRKNKGNIKYIYVTEYEEGDNGKRIHHHALIDSSVSIEELEKKWRNGFINVVPIYSDPEKYYSKIADYMMKSPKGKKSYHPSRGLKQPIINRDYSGFGDEVVRKWCFDHSSIEDEVLKWKELKEYKHLRISESPTVVSSPINNGYYIYLQMVRD